MSVQRLIYMSQAAAPLSHAQLGVILGQARMLNRRRDLTGLLGFTGRHFIQVLEGSAPGLDLLMNSLVRDRRHARLRTFVREDVAQRRFGSWAMCGVDSLDMADELDALFCCDSVRGAEGAESAIERLRLRAAEHAMCVSPASRAA